jgi:sec-independent protein translocase protein TatA
MHMLMSESSLLIAFGLPGGWEWVILLVLGLLIFGRRLPEVGRSLGRGIVEFKRGIKGIEDEVESESSRPAPTKKELADEATRDALPRGESRAEPRSHASNPYAQVDARPQDQGG